MDHAAVCHDLPNEGSLLLTDALQALDEVEALFPSLIVGEELSARIRHILGEVGRRQTAAACGRARRRCEPRDTSRRSAVSTTPSVVQPVPPDGSSVAEPVGLPTSASRTEVPPSHIEPLAMRHAEDDAEDEAEAVTVDETSADASATAPTTAAIQNDVTGDASAAVRAPTSVRSAPPELGNEPREDVGRAFRSALLADLSRRSTRPASTPPAPRTGPDETITCHASDASASTTPVRTAMPAS